MRATLNYTLPDDDAEFRAALAGGRALSALWQIDQYCRSIIKHGDPGVEAERLAKEVRAMIPAELMEET